MIICVRQLAVNKNFKQPDFTPGPLGVNIVRIPSENSLGQRERDHWVLFGLPRGERRFSLRTDRGRMRHSQTLQKKKKIERKAKSLYMKCYKKPAPWKLWSVARGDEKVYYLHYSFPLPSNKSWDIVCGDDILPFFYDLLIFFEHYNKMGRIHSNSLNFCAYQVLKYMVYNEKKMSICY